MNKRSRKRIKPTRTRRFLRWIAVALMALIGLAALTALLLYSLLRGSLAALDGQRSLEGLTGDAIVERDALGIPTIIAKRRLDVTRALGWLHAQDRFFQMDLLRRTAAGDLAELIGPALVENDKRQRQIPGRQIASSAYQALSRDEKAQLDAYAAGVNSGLSALRTRPWEYFLLRQRPKAWSPEDCFLVSLAMYGDLQDERGEKDRSHGAAKQALPPGVFQFLTQMSFEFDAALDGSKADPLPIPVAEWAECLSEHRKLNPETTDEEFLNGTNVESEGVRGSNAFLVGPGASKEGIAILANDMHLGLRVPHIWYRTALKYNTAEGEKVEINGVTLPGAPAMIVGCNTKIAWGFTNSFIDLTDLIALELDPSNPNQYRTPSGYRPFRKRTEEIKVAGDRSATYEVLDTIWGPVLVAPDGRPEFAVVWAAQQEDALNFKILALETAASAGEALAIAHTAGVPTQNFQVADRDGNIAWTLIGPVYSRDAFDSSIPVTVSDWGQGWL